MCFSPSFVFEGKGIGAAIVGPVGPSMAPTKYSVTYIALVGSIDTPVQLSI